MSKSKIAREKEPENEELSEKFAQAKEKYSLHKKFYAEALKPEEEEQEDEESETTTVNGVTLKKFTYGRKLDQETQDMVNGWRAQIQAFFFKMKTAFNFSKFEPFTFKTVESAIGTNYDIIVRVNENSNINVRVWKKGDNTIVVTKVQRKPITFVDFEAPKEI